MTDHNGCSRKRKLTQWNHVAMTDTSSFASPLPPALSVADAVEAARLTGEHFLRELDLTPAQWQALLQLSAKLKAAKKSGREQQYLRGRTIALVFAKTSTRTRCAFEVAAADQGAHTTYLDPTSSQMGHKESAADTARVLGRMFDGIEFRGDAHATVEELARYAGVPVINGLTDDWHPTQMLCDSLTMLEHRKDRGSAAARPLTFAYVGDARYNMGRSLLVTGALLGADTRIIAPPSLWPGQDVIDAAQALAAQTGARITITEDRAAVAGVDFVHTDIWVSMGEPAEAWAERLQQLRPYQVNAELMALAGTQAQFMHCLPAFHDASTTVGAKAAALAAELWPEDCAWAQDGIEVTNEVFESEASIVFDQAENRLHTIKAVLVACLADPAQMRAMS